MKLKKFCFLSIALFMMFTLALSAANIDINAEVRSFAEETSTDPEIIEMFRDVDRYRLFNFNPDLINLNSRNIGETITFSFFDDKVYLAEILVAERNSSGRTVITAKILEDTLGYAIITLSKESITISAKVQDQDEFFFASVKNGQAYLGQARLSVMAEDELPCGVQEETHYIKQPILDECNTTRNNVVIDLLYVYTPAAEQWALNDWRVTDIHHLIDVVNAQSNYVMANSETGIVFNNAHSHKTNYVEVDDFDDLDRFRFPGDGYMDEVHDLRDQYGADVLVFLAHISFTGGAAALLTSFEGFYIDYFASSINRIQQVSWSYTVVHEIGHNMGAAHHRDQNFQQGPNYSLGNYVSGWRGHIQGVMRTSVMAYTEGAYYADGIYGHNIPYFSSSLISLNGTTIGDAVLFDNARLLRETKGVTASYRTPPLNNDLTAESLIGSVHLSVNSTLPYVVRVVNSGKNTASNFTVSLREVGNDLPLVTIEGSTISSGSYQDFEISWTPTEAKQTILYGEVTWSLDAKTENNQTSRLNVTIHPPDIFMLENFDSTTVLSLLGWESDFNSRSGIFANSGINSSNALAMCAISTVTAQNATTPKIGPVTTDSVLSFEYRIVEFTDNWNAPLIPYFLYPGEFVSIEVTTSSLAGTYEQIYQIHYINQIFSENFTNITLPLSEFSSQIIDIRFRKYKTTGDWYFVLDNVAVTRGEISIFNPPRNLSATAGNEMIELFWEQPHEGSSGTLTEYILYRGTSANSLNPHATLPLSPLFYQDTGLNNGTTYFYQIVAVYTEPDGVSSPQPITPLQIMPYVWHPPQNLLLTLGVNQVSLIWQAPENGGANLSGYKVFRGTTQENMVQIHNITSNLSPTMSWINNTGITAGESYYYGIKASYSTPVNGDSDFSNIENSGIVSEDDVTIFNVITSLKSNFPNPFNPETTIRFSLEQDSMVIIEIFNVRGQLIRRLVNESLKRGVHSEIWNGFDESGNLVGTGIYFYRMTTNDYVATRKMLLMK